MSKSPPQQPCAPGVRLAKRGRWLHVTLAQPGLIDAEAERTLAQGIAEFPDRLEFAAFWAITRYNQQAYADAVRLLVQTLAASSANEGIQRYRRALLFYAGHLDEVW